RLSQNPRGSKTASRLGAFWILIEQAHFQAEDVLIPALAGQGSSPAAVEVEPVAQSKANAELGIDDCVTRGVLHFHRPRGMDYAFSSAQDRPADQFDDGTEAAATVVENVVVGADSIANDVPGKSGPAHGRPQAQFSFQAGPVAQGLVVEK